MLSNSAGDRLFIQRTQREDGPEKAMDSALRLLGRREHTRYELFSKLKIRGFAEADIQDVLNRLEENNTLSESRFTEAFVHSQVRRGFGPLKICAELGKRGIDRRQIGASEGWQHIDWVACALDVIQKQFGKDTLKTASAYAKAVRYLERRGFTLEQARKAIGEI